MEKLIKIIIAISLLACFSGCEKEEITAREYPRLWTQGVTKATEQGATYKAEIIYRGDSEILNYGFVWDRIKRPDIYNSDKIVFTDNILEDSFSADVVSSLERNKTYYVRSFIETSDYLVYGNAVSFKISTK